MGRYREEVSPVVKYVNLKFNGKELPPALKHAAYSTTRLLPGEDPAEFDALHHDIIAELAPLGRLEMDLVENIAYLSWRKKNLGSFRIALAARNHLKELVMARMPSTGEEMLAELKFGSEERIQAVHQGEVQARRELGEVFEFLRLEADEATYDALKANIEIEDRLDARIQRCLKQLALLRGVKSISTASSSPPAAVPARIVSRNDAA